MPKRGEEEMANRENLIRLSPSEARENGSKGGKKSGEVRRSKRLFQEAVLAALKARMDDGNTVLDNLVSAQIKKALDGDTKAFEVMRDTAGEKPAEKVEASVTSENKELMRQYLRSIKKEE